MLKIQDSRQIGDVTVYQDDTDWSRFYLVPAFPTIRRDANGRPIFLLTLHHFSDQGREDNPDLPRGAGFMNFDVQYTVDDTARAAIERELTEWVTQEHRRRGGTGDPPDVVLAPPLLSGGTVTMHTTQSEALTDGRLAEVDASLVAASTAVFNIDLTTEGANFMRSLFVSEGGEGNIDLTPVQIVYGLKMWARLPPVTITITADSKRVHETLLKISDTNRDDACTPREVETYRENGISSSSLHETGLVDVVIDKGDANLPTEAVEALQEFAFDLFDTMVKERFLVPAVEDGSELELEELPDGADPGWAGTLHTGQHFGGESLDVQESMGSLGSLAGRVQSVRLRSGHRLTLYTGENHTGSTWTISRSEATLGAPWHNGVRSVRMTRPPSSRSKVRQTTNTSEMQLRIRIESSQVVEWPVGGQATLQTFFAGMSDDQMRRHVVDITEDFFQTLAVDVRAVVDFEQSDVSAVEVQVEYEARDADGQRHTVGNSYTFDRERPGAQKFDPAVVGGERRYAYRTRIFYKDGLTTEFTPWQRTDRRDLNIPALDPGRIVLDISGASLKWDIVASVVAVASYAHPDGDLEPAQRTFELNELTPVGRWDHRMGKAVTGNVQVRLTYRMKDDKVVEGDPLTVAVGENLVVIPPPQVDILDVGVVPSGDWSEVVQAIVSLQYDAGAGIVYDKVLRFTAIDEFAQWQVLLRDPTNRRFSYEALIVYKDGRNEQQPRRTENGDQTIAIHVAGAPKLSVWVISNLIDFAQTPAVAVSFEYGTTTKTLTFSAGDAEKRKSFEAPILTDGTREYTYAVTWHMADGRVVESGRKRGIETDLLLTRPPVARAGKLDVIVRGFALDFAVTPFVDVALTWTDGTREERHLVTLQQGQVSGTWSLEIGDAAQRRFHYAVTYNLADGTRVPGPSATTDDPVVSVTRYQP